MKKGFTLIESLIALLLLTITLVGGMAFYFYSNDFLKYATHKRLATDIANNKLEEIKNLPYLSLPVASTLPVEGNWNLWQGPDNINIGTLQGGTRKVYLADIDEGNGVGTDYKQVAVNISWNEPSKNIPQEITLTSFIGR